MQATLFAPRGAVTFSPCCGEEVSAITGRCRVCGAKALYRYSLARDLGGIRTLAVMGVNPSTATADEDDATIRRDIGFARSLGFSRLLKLNLFAWRDRNVRGLLTAADPVGPDNDAMIAQHAAGADMLIAAWGAKTGRVGKLVNARAEKVLAMLKLIGVDVYALRVTPGGHPEHTLFLPGDLKPVLFRRAA